VLPRGVAFGTEDRRNPDVADGKRFAEPFVGGLRRPSLDWGYRLPAVVRIRSQLTWPGSGGLIWKLREHAESGANPRRCHGERKGGGWPIERS
jgi:hypothetical protein